MSLGIPIKVLHEAEGHIITCESSTGEVYRGKLVEAEEHMNLQMADVTATYRNGSTAQLANIYLRGTQIKFMILPEMLKNAPMLKVAIKASAQQSNFWKTGRGGGRGRGGGGRGGGGYGGGGRDGGYGGGRGGGGGGGGQESQGPSVFVGNIPWAATEEELTDLFQGYGQVTRFRILVDRETRRPRGMGFCEFDTKESCQSAIDGLNGYEVHGRQLRVDHARPRY